MNQWIIIGVVVLVAALALNGGFAPRAAFIDFTTPFSYEKSIMTSGRCNTIPPTVGVNNPSHAEVDSASTVIKVLQVDNSVNNMWVGTTYTTGAVTEGATDCDVYNSACTGSYITAVRSADIMRLNGGSTIDGTCSFVYNIKFKQVAPSPTEPTQPPADQPDAGMQEPPQTPTNPPVTNPPYMDSPQAPSPSERIPILSDLLDIAAVLWQGIVEAFNGLL